VFWDVVWIVCANWFFDSLGRRVRDGLFRGCFAPSTAVSLSVARGSEFFSFWELDHATGRDASNKGIAEDGAT